MGGRATVTTSKSHLCLMLEDTFSAGAVVGFDAVSSLNTFASI